MAVPRRGLQILAILVFAGGVAAYILAPEATIAALQVPRDALFSTIRMVAAYTLSLVFAITYGYTAATNKRASIVLLPVLDVLQSVPILAFFPAAVFFFVSFFNGNPVGIETAVVFLIFTSMAWNMAFGVYEAVTTIPHDLEAAATAFGLTGWLRFRLLAFPAMVPKLVYNSILSWANGWFFLVASEVFTAYGQGQAYVRPGLGSFIALAGARGDVAGIAVGIATLAAVVLALDTLVWHPMSLWSERFRMETTGEAGRPVPRVPSPYERFRWLPRFPILRSRVVRRARPLAERYARASTRLDRVTQAHPRVFRTVRRVDLAMFVVIFVLLVSTGIIGLVRLFLGPLPAEASTLPGAALFSFLRLLLAYGISLAWTIPLAAWLGTSPRAGRWLTPAIEVAASIPATALLPLIVGFAVLVVSAAEPAAQLAALLIAVIAMQWYLLFNLIAGVRAIPGDLLEASRVFGLRGRTYWKRVLLPAIVPSLLTGSITAWGAGWNALIVAEYIPYGLSLYSVPGLGSALDRATFGGDNEMLLLATLMMIVVVLAMNKLVWGPLMKRATVRFRLEV